MTQALNSSTNFTKSIKFLYSYGGKIIPRQIDGDLRYVGGYTRVLSVDRSVTFAELMVKFVESCGYSVNLKCKLPSEDLDVLISINSDEDLRNVIEEYDRALPEAKIRAVLFPFKSVKKVSPPSSPVSCFDFPPAPSPQCAKVPAAARYYVAPPCAAVRRGHSPAVGCPTGVKQFSCFEGRSPKQLYRVLNSMFLIPIRNRNKKKENKTE